MTDENSPWQYSSTDCFSGKTHKNVAFPEFYPENGRICPENGLNVKE